MRETLTYLAAAVLAVLALAFAVPPFVDWSAWSGRLGDTLGRTLGAEVALGAPLSVRLLPSPRFEVGTVRLARPGLEIEADGAAFELALAPLLRGMVSVASARLERPRVTLDPAVAASVGLAADVSFDRVFVRDATFALMTPAGVRRLDHVDVTASADGAAGPFKAEGFLRLESRLLPFRLATGTAADGRIALKGEADPLAGLPKVEAAGTLVANGDDPRFEGVVTLSGAMQGVGTAGASLPWRARIEGFATPRNARASAVELRAGDDAARLVATGTGRLDASGPALTLRSERPDFDRFRTNYDVATIARALRASVSAAALSIDWRAEAAVLGGAVATDLRVAASRAAGDPAGRMSVDASLKLPRETVLSFAGAVDAPAHASGHLALRSDDASSLLRWLGALVPSAALPVDVPVEHVEIAAQINADADRVVLRDISAVLDRSVIAGNASFVAAHGNALPRIDATLEAQALDIDSLPDLSRLRAAIEGVDFALTFDARATKVSRVGGTPVEAGRFGLSIMRGAGALTLERLTLDNLAGANARAKGRIAAGDAHIEGRLDARQLADFAALLARVVPGPAADLLATRARLLSPATVDLRLDATASDGALAPTNLALSGKAADTSFRATLAPVAGQPDAVAGTITIDAPEAANLLRQAGVPVIPLRGQGAGRIEAKLSGSSGAPLSVVTTGTIAGAALSFDGRVRFNSQQREADGTVRLAARDLGPLLRIVAAPVDTFARWPADLTARVAVQAAGAQLTDIAGNVAGTNVSGRLSRDCDAGFAGALRLSRLDLPALAAVLLGPLQPMPAGKIFTPAKWSQQPNDPPAAAIDLAVDSLDLGGLAATSVTAKVSIGPGEISARDATMTLAGGTVTGTATLRRREDTASLSASLGARDLSLSLPWLSASVSGRAAITGAGTSAADLIGSLAGSGTLRLADARIARADPDAVVRTANAVDAEQIDLAPPAILSALSRAFDAAPQNLPTLEQPVAIGAGQFTIEPFDLPIGSGRATLDARYDVLNDRIALRETLRPAPPRFWDGTTPSVTLRLSGSRENPVRTIDAADLIGTLAEHGFTREQARIAAIEADQRERAYFNRRLKADRAMEAARKAEEAAIEAARKEAERQETLRQDAARQEAARLERERRAAERALQAPAGTAPNAPLELRPPAARSGGSMPSIIAPDPGTAGRY